MAGILATTLKSGATNLALGVTKTLMGAMSPKASQIFEPMFDKFEAMGMGGRQAIEGQTATATPVTEEIRRKKANIPAGGRMATILTGEKAPERLG